MAKRFSLKYLSSDGVAIDFNGRPYTWERSTDLLDYMWDIISVDNVNANGAKISNFVRRITSKQIDITVYPGDGSSVDPLISHLANIFERDVILKKPGRIYVNNSYINCYIQRSVKTLYKSIRLAKISFSLAIESPFWITEELHTFEPLSTGSTDGFIFPLGFPYGFVSPDVRTLINDHYGPCMAKISFYGPCTDPEINLGPNTYKVFGELLPGERFEIDQVAMTVTKITAGGERLNFLYARNKAKSVFDRIPAGESFVTATDFTFDILLYKERSEPKWS